MENIKQQIVRQKLTIIKKLVTKDKNGDTFIIANREKNREFILEDGIFDYYELDQVNNGNGIEWKIVLLKEIFDSFEWIDEEKFEATNLGNNSARGVFKIKFKSLSYFFIIQR